MKRFCLLHTPLLPLVTACFFTNITYGFFYNFYPLTEALCCPFLLNNEWTHLKLQVFALISSSRQEIQETWLIQTAAWGPNKSHKPILHPSALPPRHPTWGREGDRTLHQISCCIFPVVFPVSFLLYLPAGKVSEKLCKVLEKLHQVCPGNADASELVTFPSQRK